MFITSYGQNVIGKKVMQRNIKAQQDKKKEEQSEQVQKVENTKEETRVEENQDTLENAEQQEVKSDTQAQTVTSSSKKEVKLDDCDAIYEIGSDAYATCELTLAQNQTANLVTAMIFIMCIILGGVISALIVFCINKSIDREHERRKKDRESGFTIM